MFIEQGRGYVRNKILYTLIFRRTMSLGVCEIMFVRRGAKIYTFIERCDE